MSEAVQKHVIGPMQALYPPPQHLRADAGRRAAALAEYVRALAPFDEQTLAAGWTLAAAAHRFWAWPSPGEIVAACRSVAPARDTGDGEKRRAEALATADAYAGRFMKSSHLAKLARDEGWAARLLEYVWDAAWVQSQLICGLVSVGFATNLVPPDRRHLPAAEAFADLRDAFAAAVGRGRVRVTVPTDRVSEWKAEAAREASAKPRPRHAR